MKILYHANCVDGMGAALAAWTMLGDKLGNEYIPVQYGKPLPNDLDDQRVFMLDFSVKRDVLKDLANRARSIQIIDHHASAECELDGVEDELDNVKVMFNMEKSGAVLTWEYFYPDSPVPRLFKYIQDRDLWQFKLYGTNAVHAALQLYHHDFRELKLYVDDPELIGPDLIDTGKPIVDYLKGESTRIIDSETQFVSLAGETIPIYNLNGFLVSDTLKLALDKHQWAPFVASYYESNGQRIYSLCSRKGSDVDVGKIAAKYGGGGHKHSAGFTTLDGKVEM